LSKEEMQMTSKYWKAVPTWDFQDDNKGAYAEGTIQDNAGNTLIKMTGRQLDLGHSEVCGTFEECQTAHILEAGITP
jgi:hypothetical protein